MSFLKKENLLLKKKKKKKVAINAAKKAAKELDKKVDQNLQKQGRKGIKIENAKVWTLKRTILQLFRDEEFYPKVENTEMIWETNF